ncbi:hypothetical protein ES332_D02G127700v1 [Gossypium tomentosum]|uniref:Uncharacterized protein n=1 Tax=Gossypium tomentosum TaxID=34277 RepID=A0A5D2LWB6_GOSTO|nr:hypothetical protein ES332_D02G127700v1 [Gossypium tomentosum]
MQQHYAHIVRTRNTHLEGLVFDPLCPSIYFDFGQKWLPQIHTNGHFRKTSPPSSVCIFIDLDYWTNCLSNRFQDKIRVISFW